ncbi:MAG: hypothetical protein Q7S69_01065 [Nitrosomonadaceae bacterium]|nr:hypothetical protein [Nitrosomonadaceae bacterium]
MKEETKDTLLKVIPSGDSRRRIYSSIKLWVVNRSWTKDKKHVVVCGVMGSIERIIHQFEGKQGQWVRYEGYYHLLHSTNEFSELLRNSKKHQFSFFNNVLHGRGDATIHTEPAPFIYCDCDDWFLGLTRQSSGVQA